MADVDADKEAEETNGKGEEPHAEAEEAHREEDRCAE